MREVTGIGGVMNGSGAQAQPRSAYPGRVGEARRRASGPRPVRPAAPLALVRPLQPARPSCAADPVRVGGPEAVGQRVLVRPPVAAEAQLRGRLHWRLRRALAGLAVFVAAVAVVVALGLVASAASAQRAQPAAGEIHSVVEVPGQVLRVPAG
jgi:hypothetical protein